MCHGMSECVDIGVYWMAFFWSAAIAIRIATLSSHSFPALGGWYSCDGSCCFTPVQNLKCPSLPCACPLLATIRKSCSDSNPALNMSHLSWHNQRHCTELPGQSWLWTTQKDAQMRQFIEKWCVWGCLSLSLYIYIHIQVYIFKPCVWMIPCYRYVCV